MTPSRYLAQRTHLTVPATVAKYVEGAVTKSDADLVMLDLEDSIPRDDDALLRAGRDAIVRAMNELDWGRKLRFFRPRGAALDPSHDDIRDVVARAGARVEGLVYPKVESADEVRAVDATLAALEAERGLARGSIRIAVLVESVLAEERAFAIAAASPRIVALVFGAFDHFASLGMLDVAYRFDHPLVDGARARIAKAAASVGVAAIAEMSTSFPTKDKSDAERAAALAECRRDAEHAKSFGFRGKWVGIPAQVAIVNDVFALDAAAVARAVVATRAFLAAERAGRGALIVDGKMHDRANDRVARVLLETAWATGHLDDATARELGLDRGAASRR
jgi:citrate lyase subunit beta/citryl-CoA lyase